MPEARDSEREDVAEETGSEAVLAKKGVDWRARDRELDLHPRTAPRPHPRRSQKKRAAATATTKGAVAAHGATARGAPQDHDAAGAGRTPHPRGRCAASSTLLPLPPMVSHSAWGGSKRKCAGEGPGPSRRVRQVDGQRRKVFGELNVGEGCASSIRAPNNKGCDSGGSQAEGLKSSMGAVADGENRCSMVPATKVTATEANESAVAQKRKGGAKRRKGKRSKAAPNQETLAKATNSQKIIKSSAHAKVSTIPFGSATMHLQASVPNSNVNCSVHVQLTCGTASTCVSAQEPAKSKPTPKRFGTSPLMMIPPWKSDKL